jgi:hypothetical protein
MAFKGTVSRDFLLLVFFMNQFPPAPEYSIKTISNFFKKFAEMFASRGAPLVSLIPVAICHRRLLHRCQLSTTQAELVAKFAAGVVDTGGKFAAGVVDTGVVP